MSRPIRRDPTLASPEPDRAFACGDDPRNGLLGCAWTPARLAARRSPPAHGGAFRGRRRGVLGVLPFRSASRRRDLVLLSRRSRAVPLRARGERVRLTRRATPARRRGRAGPGDDHAAECARFGAVPCGARGGGAASPVDVSRRSAAHPAASRRVRADGRPVMSGITSSPACAPCGITRRSTLSGNAGRAGLSTPPFAPAANGSAPAPSRSCGCARTRTTGVLQRSRAAPAPALPGVPAQVRKLFSLQRTDCATSPYFDRHRRCRRPSAIAWVGPRCGLFALARRGRGRGCFTRSPPAGRHGDRHGDRHALSTPCRSV
jgi:hypothetical protein